MEKNLKRLIAKVKTTNGSFGTPVSTDLGAVYDKLRSGDNEECMRNYLCKRHLEISTMPLFHFSTIYTRAPYNSRWRAGSLGTWLCESISVLSFRLGALPFPS